MKTIQFDTEFNNSQERFVNPICGVVYYEGKRYDYIYPRDNEVFCDDFRNWVFDIGVTVIAHYCSAEVRTLLALGFTNPEILNIKFLDTFVMWRMLTHSHPRYKYGWQIETNIFGAKSWIKTVPPPFKEAGEPLWGLDSDGVYRIIKEVDPRYKKNGNGLLDVLAALFKIDGDKARKDQMRDLILSKNHFSDDEMTDIVHYCADDTKDLLMVAKELIKCIVGESKKSVSLEDLVGLSAAVAEAGIVENEGIPISYERFSNLASNYNQIDDSLVSEANEYYPFYLKNKEDKWIESETQFINYLKSRNLLKSWPKTDKGNVKRDEKTIKNYEADPLLKKLHSIKHNRKQLNALRPVGFEKIKQNIGSDGRVRVLISPFGSKTGRYQPSVSKGWVFGMSSWFRPILDAGEDVLIGADFSAQEIALQAHVSKDQSFLKSYESGDPYTWFAQACRQMRADVYRKGGKFYLLNGVLCDEEEQIELAIIRTLFKAVTLGVGFGLGYLKLGNSLTMNNIASLPKPKLEILQKSLIDVDNLELQTQAREILVDIYVYSGTKEFHKTKPKHQLATTYKGYHQSVFKKYWSWRDSILKKYQRNGFLKLPDGWCLFRGEDRDNTVANFPVQGLGGVILRVAIRLCLRRGLKVFAPLHDCIYIISSKGDAPENKNRLASCMQEAVQKVTGKDFIRIDPAIYTTDWKDFNSKWVEDKGGREFKKFGKYFLEPAEAEIIQQQEIPF